MAYGSVTCLTVCIVLTVIAWTSVTIRLYVRLHLQNGIFTDDIFSILATAVYTALVVLYIIGVLQHGIGRTTADVPKETYAEGVKDTVICELLYLTATYLIKLSFIFTLFRIVIEKLYIYTLYLLMATGAVVTITLGLWLVFLCRPVEYFWQQFMAPIGQDGTCKSIASLTAVTLVHAAWILAADSVLGIVLPALLLRRIQLQATAKISAFVLLGLGSTLYNKRTIVATVVRFVYLPRLSMTESLLHNNPVIFWSNIEVSLGIIFTAAATWRPLMVKLLVFTRSSSTRCSTVVRRSNGRGGQSSQPYSSWPANRKDFGKESSSREEFLSEIQGENYVLSGVYGRDLR